MLARRFPSQIGLLFVSLKPLSSFSASHQGKEHDRLNNKLEFIIYGLIEIQFYQKIRSNFPACASSIVAEKVKRNPPQLFYTVKDKIEEHQQHQNFPDESTIESTSNIGIGKNLIVEDDLKSPSVVGLISSPLGFIFVVKRYGVEMSFGIITSHDLGYLKLEHIPVFILLYSSSPRR
ncbi:hypothetical protein P8452_00869 [Trifolium repens]|nr:hypothetical protein P8452_00869 [Trifolium repens]